MLFIEFRFLFFFLAVFCVHWALKRDTPRKAWLLLCSYAFYAAWDWRFLSLIIISTLVDYVVGLKLVQPGARRRVWISVSLCANLGLLGVFKYFNFFRDSLAEVLTWLGITPDLPTLDVILPVGISFYTFQTLSYSLDIFFGKLKPTRKLLDLAVFVGFFPQLVAGPIVRAADFLPQLRKPRVLARVDYRAALMLFLVGFIKKACISDNVAPIVDEYFAAPQDFNALAAWTAILYYAVQIYCDFSGYSDMAIACAALLGYQLRLNFNFPYMAVSITDFWRRWHISLSSWLRDYLYIPLGGSRGSKWFTYRNLMLTMLLGGLWHGAAWNFVIWGGLHGLALGVHKEWTRRVSAESPLRRALRLPAPLLTFWFVCVCWIFFRASGVENSTTALRAFVLFESPGRQHFGYAFLWIFPALGMIHWITYRRLIAGWWRGLPDWAFAAVLGVMAAVVLAFVPASSSPFIYFQF